MKTSIEFMQRKNCGNYEHQELKISIVTKEGADLVEEVKTLMTFVDNALYEKGPFCINPITEREPDPKTVENKTAVTGGTQVLKPKPQTARERAAAKEALEKAQTDSAAATEATTEEAATENTNLTSKDEAAVEEAVAKVEKEAAKEEAAKVEKEDPKARKKETTVRVKVSKTTAYDRELATHKALLGTFLNAEFPDWKKPLVLKEKTGPASRKLHGTEFQDGEGNILESFKVAFRAEMA